MGLAGEAAAAPPCPSIECLMLRCKGLIRRPTIARLRLRWKPI
jgi:hypothetical protein